jgi:hypothetical protein
MRKFITFVLAIAIMITGFTPLSVSADHGASAAGLRAVLTAQLGEHVILAGAATNAALNGSDAEFNAAAGALDENSIALADTIGLVYGDGAEEAFLALWRKHIGFFVDYTVGAATDDEAMKQMAITSLDGYRNDFAAFISGANPNLPKDVIAESLIPHIELLSQAIDAQKAGDFSTAYMKLREAYAHTAMLGLALSTGIDAQFPEQYEGDADASYASLRTLLSSQLGEHVLLAGAATNAALQGRSAEFDAAAAALDANSVDLSQSIASVYGEDAGNAFLPLWRAHIGFFVDYTLGAAAMDQNAKDAARAELDGYRNDFAAFISGANPFLPKDAVAENLVPHIETLTSVIDAQSTQDFTMAFTSLRESYEHTGMLGKILADAIAQQYPEQFMMVSMPEAMPNTGHASTGTHLPSLSLIIGGITVLALAALTVITRYRLRPAVQNNG